MFTATYYNCLFLLEHKHLVVKAIKPTMKLTCNFALRYPPWHAAWEILLEHQYLVVKAFSWNKQVFEVPTGIHYIQWSLHYNQNWVWHKYGHPVNHMVWTKCRAVDNIIEWNYVTGSVEYRIAFPNTVPPFTFTHKYTFHVCTIYLYTKSRRKHLENFFAWNE